MDWETASWCKPRAWTREGFAPSASASSRYAYFEVCVHMLHIISYVKDTWRIGYLVLYTSTVCCRFVAIPIPLLRLIHWLENYEQPQHYVCRQHAIRSTVQYSMFLLKIRTERGRSSPLVVSSTIAATVFVRGGLYSSGGKCRWTAVHIALLYNACIQHQVCCFWPVTQSPYESSKAGAG